MRNSTMLKNILMRYSIALDMEDEDVFRLMLTDKVSGAGAEFEGKSFSAVLRLAHAHMLRTLKS